jgi:drug/metabolite transporter (DMT)-like permease
LKLANALRLTALAALWGATFLFLRIAVPSLGPAMLIEARLAIAAIFLTFVGLAMGRSLAWVSRWRHYALLGGLNSALPFVLFAYAAQTLPASLLAILNATTPAFGVVAMALWTRARPAASVLVGLVLGLVGVAITLGADTFAAPGAGWAVAASLGATCSYGIASVYTKYSAAGDDAVTSAHGNMWAATLLVLPLALVLPAPALPGPGVIAAVLALGILSTGLAYLIYFRLVADAGPTYTLTVTYLIPVFGVFWGVVFLDERVGWNTFVGAAVVLAGTALVTGVGLPRRRPVAAAGTGS